MIELKLKDVLKWSFVGANNEDKDLPIRFSGLPGDRASS